MADHPLRVAVISPSQVVRAGLVNLVAQLGLDAVITDAAAEGTGLTGHDVVVFDLGAMDDMSSYAELQRIMNTGAPVVGLVYEGPVPRAGSKPGRSPNLISLLVTPEQLLEALRAAVGEADDRPAKAANLRLPAGLTEQEFVVLELIGAGLPNAAIAKEMYVSINSVKTYIRQAYRKIGATSRAGAILWAVEHGLAGGPDQR
ncbi:MAG TPA: response regulator transcription factor [Nocardioides sp.]|uniref:helix-turn-helix transcriptional regulator n=1 Tax=uncultured Nocardioides sp. TaxID=198441 RepID=UPI0026144ADD|nr:response regulator transcription factor [uncultured Nocardioides sp.]HRD62370.1 response regulator transcription factor [Nocardioides sp.]HRI94591.1 response regulator transcription factor [Nocardioides sp.]HRK46390.1 response regulator transcription factor [Nocardioides sp.]